MFDIALIDVLIFVSNVIKKDHVLHAVVFHRQH